MVGDGREWLAAQPLPETAREQVTIAIAMIDALEAQIAPIDKQLRAYARRQPGCKALMPPLRDRGAERGHDPRRARRRPPVSTTAATRSVTRAWTSPSISPTSIARPASSPAKDRQRCAGRCTRPRNKPGIPAAPTASTTSRPPSGSAVTARASRSPANCSSAATSASRTLKEVSCRKTYIGGAVREMEACWRKRRDKPAWRSCEHERRRWIGCLMVVPLTAVL